ncbi:MAG TPA: carboxypeptidase-like regulatory domain-containing protein [Gammaproteobacteria bacterium]|nr:carboxypeptidase-like regulatory domain-containing protein [Gammaproteobacteria bacterium]
MRATTTIRNGVVIATTALLVALGAAVSAQVAIDADDIGGVVASPNGPEAGVWVIAETDDLDTFYAKIVVTDEMGRYLVPDLPDADYQLWVRGYGLADSEKVAASPGETVDLEAVIAPDAAVAAEIYPAIAWYAMMHIPDDSELASLEGGLNRYLNTMKTNGCITCHQLGNAATRTIPEVFRDFENSEQAWIRRIQSGQAGATMVERLAADLQGIPFKYLADWTDRIAAGELPAFTPERPQGVERNIVATVRDWSDAKAYLHDLSSTDRRDPTVNAYGKIYGSPEVSTDDFPILDPVANTATTFAAPVRDADTPFAGDVMQPSAYWGRERIWDSKANSHNPMLDQDGRVWYTARIRAPGNPDFCQAGSDHPSAKVFPTSRANRHLSLRDPETGEYTFIDTCYSTHHLQFAYDENDTLWTSGGGEVVGWLDTKEFLKTKDAVAAQGWTPAILDTNGNGKRDAYVEPDQPVNPALDKRIVPGFYAIMPNPADGSIWGSNDDYPGSLVRLELGDNPAETSLAEVYNVPLPGFGMRGADIDSEGVIWGSLASGHLSEFDRRKCEGPLNGPAATGDHCPEGWTLHRLPGPGFPGLEAYSVESSYYSWVDQHNTAGLGEDVPMATGNLYDGVHALVDGEWVTMRIPYPLGFYTKGFDGRIDDPSAGWKGRGLWVSEGDRTPFWKVGGTDKPIVVHFQVRPDPLAK